LLGSGQPSLVWVWKIFPTNPKISNFFPSNKKPVLGQVKKYPGQRQVDLLFTVGQRYAQVGLDQGPSLVETSHFYNCGKFGNRWKKVFLRLILRIAFGMLRSQENLNEMGNF